MAAADTVVVTKRWPELDALAALLDERHRVVDLVGLDGFPRPMSNRHLGIGW
ncbi:MAG: hypothetical protein ABJC24_01685 [Chloroflexota bacterium]